MKKIKKKQAINKMILLFLILQTKATADFYPKYNKKNQKVYAMKKTNLLKANEIKKNIMKNIQLLLNNQNLKININIIMNLKKEIIFI